MVVLMVRANTGKDELLEVMAMAIPPDYGDGFLGVSVQFSSVQSLSCVQLFVTP